MLNQNENDPLFMRMKYAAFDGIEDMRALLDEFPEALESRSYGGETALHWWVIENHLDAVKRLIEVGAIVDTKSDVIGPTPLMGAATLGLTEMAQLLIDHEASIHAVDIHGDTPLHYAASSNQSKMIHFLIERGAELTAKNLMNETPLDIAHVMDSSDAIAAINIEKNKKS